MKKSIMSDWEKQALNELKSKKLSELKIDLDEGFTLSPLYTESDLSSLKASLETMPGSFPFTRGPKATMYANRPWTIRQYAGFASVEKTNEFYLNCLNAGQHGLSVAFDLPTHRGYDSDNPLVSGDVGKAGVAVDSVEDMKQLFASIPLSNVSVSMTMNGAVLPILASFIVAAEESGVQQKNLSGTIQNDILKEFLVRNTYIYPPKPSMRIVSDIIEHVSKHMPRFNPISISGYHIHEAGADLALELGLTLANGLEYVRSALNKGLKIDDFAPRLSFFFATGMNFYLEVAKLRAARFLWAKLMKQFKPQNERSYILRTHCQTSGWSLTAEDPYNNIVRTTVEAMAAVFGGTQSLHTNSFDEALALPTPFSAKIARNTQLILQHETKIPSVVDPWAGSYMMESLTDQLANKAAEIIAKVESKGGMTKAIVDGLPKVWIDESATKRQAKIDSGKEQVVGVNCFRADIQEEVEILNVNNDEVRKKQLEKIVTLRKMRDARAVDTSLKTLEKGAKESANLLSLSIDAVRKRATIGEISSTLEKVFGRYEAKVSTLTGVYKNAFSNDDEFKKVAAAVESFSKREGRRPRIMVVKMGQDGHDRGAKVVATAFADLGFDVDISPLFLTPKQTAKQAVENDVHVIGVSSLAAGHMSLIPDLMSCLKKENADDVLVVAGGIIPKSDYNFLKEIGVSEIFTPGMPILDSAMKVLDALAKRSNVKQR